MGAMDEHVADQIAAVEETLTHVDEVLGNLDSIDYNEVVKGMTPLERARYDLTNLYAINSMFWMYMRSFGENPHAGAMKEELDRIKKQMMRLSEIANKSKMPRINKDVANRMVRHELWEPASSGSPSTVAKTQRTGNEEGENWDEPATEPMETDASKSKSRKRKVEDTFEPEDEISNTGNPSDPSSSASTSGDDDDEEDEDEEDEQSSSAQEETDSEDES